MSTLKGIYEYTKSILILIEYKRELVYLFVEGSDNIKSIFVSILVYNDYTYLNEYTKGVY